MIKRVRSVHWKGRWHPPLVILNRRCAKTSIRRPVLQIFKSRVKQALRRLAKRNFVSWTTHEAPLSPYVCAKIALLRGQKLRYFPYFPLFIAHLRAWARFFNPLIAYLRPNRSRFFQGHRVGILTCSLGTIFFGPVTSRGIVETWHHWKQIGRFGSFWHT